MAPEARMSLPIHRVHHAASYSYVSSASYSPPERFSRSDRPESMRCRGHCIMLTDWCSLCLVELWRFVACRPIRKRIGDHVLGWAYGSLNDYIRMRWLSRNKNVLVAGWCRSCRRLKPLWTTLGRSLYLGRQATSLVIRRQLLFYVINVKIA